MEKFANMDNRKRILQANINNLGGAFSVAYEAQKELRNDFVFDYFSPDKFIDNDIYRDLLSMGSVCIGDIKSKSKFLRQYEIYKAFSEYLRNNAYEFVHIHADTAWKLSIYYLAARKAGAKNIVVHSHSSGINGNFKKINYILHCIAKHIIKKAKYKCACSDVAAKWMFYTTKNVNIIRNGVDIERYRFKQCARDRIRKELRINDKIVIGSVSDYSYQKNPEFLFKIIEALKNNPRYVFLMVGNRDVCLLKEHVERDKTIKNVIFSGMVTNTQDYLSAMDIFVLPSRFEGLPMCALEAQVSGVFTIISDKVTIETECSKYFCRLKLDKEIWRKKIVSVDLDYNRENIDEYLNIDKASSSNMTDKFRKIYEGK